MKYEVAKAIVWAMVGVGVVIAVATYLGALYHELMHVIVYRRLGIDAWINTRLSTRSAEPHALGLWAAYPMEIWSYAVLAWVLTYTRAWWAASGALGFAFGKIPEALYSYDYNRIALAVHGPTAPETFKELFIIFVIPVYIFIAVLVIRRISACLYDVRIENDIAKRRSLT